MSEQVMHYEFMWGVLFPLLAGVPLLSISWAWLAFAGVVEELEHEGSGE